MEVRITGPDSRLNLEKELVDCKIVGVSTASDCLWLALDNGKTLQVTFRSGMGADSDWYDWLFAKVYKEGE